MGHQPPDQAELIGQPDVAAPCSVQTQLMAGTGSAGNCRAGISREHQSAQQPHRQPNACGRFCRHISGMPWPVTTFGVTPRIACIQTKGIKRQGMCCPGAAQVAPPCQNFSPGCPLPHSCLFASNREIGVYRRLPRRPPTPLCSATRAVFAHRLRTAPGSAQVRLNGL